MNALKKKSVKKDDQIKKRTSKGFQYTAPDELSELVSSAVTYKYWYINLSDGLHC